MKSELECANLIWADERLASIVEETGIFDYVPRRRDAKERPALAAVNRFFTVYRKSASKLVAAIRARPDYDRRLNLGNAIAFYIMHEYTLRRGGKNG